MFGCVWCVMVCVCLEAATKKSCCKKACIVTILCTDMYNLLIVPPLTSLKRLAFLCWSWTCDSSCFEWHEGNEEPLLGEEVEGLAVKPISTCVDIIYKFYIKYCQFESKWDIWFRHTPTLLFHRVYRDAIWRCIRRYSKKDSGSFDRLRG